MPRKKRTLAAALAEIDTRLDADELLDAAARERIREKAREHVLEKRRKEAEALALAAAIEEEERRYQVQEDYEYITIHLAPYAAMVTLDGTMYFHGLEYEVPYSVARTLDDITARTWEHQNEIMGQRRKGDVAWESARRRRYENGGVRVNSPDAANLEQAMHATINRRAMPRM